MSSTDADPPVRTEPVAHATVRPSIVNRSPVYYGWIIWVVAMIGMTASMPGQTANVSLFIDQWIADFGLEDRSTISALYGVGTFVASLSLTFVGTFVDRLGNRKMAVIIAGLFALALIYMAFVSNLTMLLIGFVLIRGLGQGSMMLVNTTAIANWFVRMRGRMMAFALIGFSLFQRWYIPAVQDLLTEMAWQRVWLILAAVILLFVMPLGALFIRETPERFGVQPDGDHQSTQEVELARSKEINFTLRQAMRRPIFWVFLFSSVMSPAFVTGIVFHQQSLFELGGYSPQVAAKTVADGILYGSVFSIIAGYLIDRIRPSFVKAFELSGLVGLMVLSQFLGGAAWMLPMWVVLLAIVMGTGGVFDSAVWPNLFGRAHQGEIRGFVATVTVTGTSAGPFLLALSFDAFGDYGLSLFMAAGVTLIPLVAALFMTKPKPFAEG
ncbi:MAG: MFS transporter [Chloroflexota bacterium]